MSAKARCQQKLEKAYVSLSMVFPFYSYLLYKAKVTFSEENVLARVSQNLEVTLGVEFADSLSQEEFTGILLHEILHVVLMIHSREKGRRRDLMNIAHDYVVNALVMEASGMKFRNNSVVELPSGGLYCAEKGKSSAEELYALFAQQLEDNKSNGSGGKDSKERLSLSFYDKDKGRSEEKEVELANFALLDVEEENLTDAQIAQLENKMKQLLIEAEMHHEGCKQRGTLPLGLRAVIENAKKTFIPWSSYIRSYVGERACLEEPTYLRRSRRSEAVGEIMPGMRKKHDANIVLLWDTSGSMHGLHETVGAEFVSLVREKGYAIRLLQCDATVQSDEIIDENTKFEVKGHGGSDFCPAFELLEKDVNTKDLYVIAMTDGAISVPQTMPENVIDTLWVIVGSWGGPPTKDWGHAIRLDVRTGCVEVIHGK